MNFPYYIQHYLSKSAAVPGFNMPGFHEFLIEYKNGDLLKRIDIGQYLQQFSQRVKDHFRHNYENTIEWELVQHALDIFNLQENAWKHGIKIWVSADILYIDYARDRDKITQITEILYPAELELSNKEKAHLAHILPLISEKLGYYFLPKSRGPVEIRHYYVQTLSTATDRLNLDFAVVFLIDDLQLLSNRLQNSQMSGLVVTFSINTLANIIAAPQELLKPILPYCKEIKIYDDNIAIPQLIEVATAVQALSPVLDANEGSSSNASTVKISTQPDALLMVTPDTTVGQLKEAIKFNGNIALENKGEEFQQLLPECAAYITAYQLMDRKIHESQLVDLATQVQSLTELKHLTLDNLTIIGRKTAGQLLSKVLVNTLEHVTISQCDLYRGADPSIAASLAKFIKAAVNLQTLQLPSNTACQNVIIAALLESKTVVAVTGISSPELSEHLNNNANAAAKKAQEIAEAKQREEEHKQFLAHAKEVNKAREERLIALKKQYEDGELFASEQVPANEIFKLKVSLQNALSYNRGDKLSSKEDNTGFFWLVDVTPQEKSGYIATFKHFLELLDYISSIQEANRKGIHEFTANTAIDLTYILDIVERHGAGYITNLIIKFPLAEGDIDTLVKLFPYMEAITFSNAEVSAEQVKVLEAVKEKLSRLSITNIGFENVIMDAVTHQSLVAMVASPLENTRVLRFRNGQISSFIPAEKVPPLIFIGKQDAKLVEAFLTGLPYRYTDIQFEDGAFVPSILTQESGVTIVDVETLQAIATSSAEPTQVKKLSLDFRLGAYQSEMLARALALLPASKLSIAIPLCQHNFAEALANYLESSTMLENLELKPFRTNTRYLTLKDAQTIYNAIIGSTSITRCDFLTRELLKLHDYTMSIGEFSQLLRVIVPAIQERNLDTAVTIEQIQQRLSKIMQGFTVQAAKSFIKEDEIQEQHFKNIINRLLQKWFLAVGNEKDTPLIDLIASLRLAILTKLDDKARAGFSAEGFVSELKTFIIGKLNTDAALNDFIFNCVKHKTIDELLSFVENAATIKPFQIFNNMNAFVDRFIQVIGKHLGSLFVESGRNSIPGMIDDESRFSNIRTLYELTPKLEKLKLNTTREVRQFFANLISTINEANGSWMNHAGIYQTSLEKFVDLTKRTSINSNILINYIRFSLHCQQYLRVHLNENGKEIPKNIFDEEVSKLAGFSSILKSYPELPSQLPALFCNIAETLFKAYEQHYNSKESNTPLDAEVKLLEIIETWGIELDDSMQKIMLGILQAKIYRQICIAGKFHSIQFIQTNAVGYVAPKDGDKGKRKLTKADIYYPLVQKIQAATGPYELIDIVDTALVTINGEKDFKQGWNYLKSRMIPILQPTAPIQLAREGNTPGGTPTGITPGGPENSAPTGVTPGAPEDNVPTGVTPGAPEDSAPTGVTPGAPEDNAPTGETPTKTYNTAGEPDAAAVVYASQQFAPPSGIGFGYSGEPPPAPPVTAVANADNTPRNPNSPQQ